MGYRIVHEMLTTLISYSILLELPEFAVSMMCFYAKSTIWETIYRSLVFHFLRPSSAQPRILYVRLLEMSWPNIAAGHFFSGKKFMVQHLNWLAIRMTRHLSGFG